MSMELAIAMKALKEAKNLEGSIEDVVRKYMEENPVTIDDTLTKANMAADAKTTGDKIKSAIDKIYNARVLQATSKKEVDTLFVEWWNYQYDSTHSKSEMLERWFGTVLNDSRVHGEKQPLYTKSTSVIGELTDDSTGFVCTPSTETTAGNDPFAHLPQFWCLEVSAEKNADGSHAVYYVEHIDDTADVRSGEHLCWVLQKNTYKREWQDNEYKYLKTRCHPAPGYKRWPEGKDKTGKVHEYIAHPKYYAGIGPDGKITCGTGLAPVNSTSHSTGVTKWRARGPQYSGASGSLIKFLDTMTRLKYGKKGNSGTITGCVSFYEYYRSGIKEIGPNFVGMTNYVELFKSDMIAYGKNTLILWLIGFVPQIVVALVLANWFTDARLKIHKLQFFKVVIYLPNLIMASAFALLFFTLFSNSGPVNSILQSIGLISQPIDFMGSVFGTRSLIGFMNFLMWFGNTTIMLMAAVMGISTEVFEAADIDGCNAIQRFFYITLPGIRPILAYTLITSIIGGLQMFDVPQILTNGQGNPDRTSMTLIMFLNNHLKSKNYGMAGALSVYLFIVSGILCFFVYRMTNDTDPDGSKAAAKKAAKEAKRKKKEEAR